jgi:hypothetical protein
MIVQKSFLNINSILASILAMLCVASCTDVVVVDIELAEERIVIDAWLNNKSEVQTVRLTLSQPYFSNAFAPGISDAVVTVVRNEADTLEFANQGDGNYNWTPQPGALLGDPGMTFHLNIDWRGEIYQGLSQMRRVPLIDTIRIEERNGELGYADGHWASLIARDLPGLGDTYWIKAYKNGIFLNKPNELNIAYDAGFDASGELDGVVFIVPIRELINRFPDPDTDDDFDVPPYVPGDEVHVEIHSITRDAFYFLQTARDQMNNGDNTIFSIPVANTQSNVFRQSDGGSAIGFFCVSAVSEKTRLVD